MKCLSSGYIGVMKIDGAGTVSYTCYIRDEKERTDDSEDT
jgi:hypothetical protein